MKINLHTTPFSCAGSWLSLAVPEARYQPLGTGLYLRSHHSRPLALREISLVQLLRDGMVLESTPEATPEALVLRANDGSAQATFAFAGDDDLLVEVEGGASLQLQTKFDDNHDRASAVHFSAFREASDRVTINARPALLRLGVSALSGSVEIDAPWNGETCAYCHVTLVPDENGHCAGRIAEYQSTWQPRPMPSVAEAAKRQQALFTSFAKHYASDDASQLAAYVLWSCTMRPSGQLKRRSVFMSLNWMDQVWTWDNIFNLLALVPSDEDLAFDQLMVVADHQDEHGAYPDGMNDGFKHYNYSKPPVQGILFSWLEKRHPNFFTPTRRRLAYDTISRFTNWWLNHRFNDEHKLCYYLHGNDSGWDNGTLLREGAPLLAPDLNAFLATQCAWLADCAQALGYQAEAQVWIQRRRELIDALLATLWNGTEFVGLHLPSGRLVTSQSLIAVMPALLGEALSSAQQEACITRVKACLTDWGPATELTSSGFYEDDGYWRGPIWGPSTMLTVIGLEAIGAQELAQDVQARYCKLCATSDFAENFDAKTGAPLRDKAYTWTASAFLALGSGAKPLRP